MVTGNLGGEEPALLYNNNISRFAGRSLALIYRYTYIRARLRTTLLGQVEISARVAKFVRLVWF